ncbi:MAG: DUF6265 family protein [Gemmatimonadota bacterium]
MPAYPLRGIRSRLAAALAVAALAAPAPAVGQGDPAGPPHLTAHTLRLDSTATPGPATLADADWLVGVWDGEGLGGRVQETWAPPVADRMTGTFTSLGDDGIRFQELMALVEVEGTLELWVKHFNADFSAWEEKADFARFRLVEREPGVLRFHGLTLSRVGDDGLRIHLALRTGEEVREEVLEYRRVVASR